MRRDFSHWNVILAARWVLLAAAFANAAQWFQYNFA